MGVLSLYLSHGLSFSLTFYSKFSTLIFGFYRHSLAVKVGGSLTFFDLFSLLMIRRFLDVSNGYMSEGGITVYARKMQARFKEGLEAVRDGMRHRQINFNDRSLTFILIIFLVVLLQVMINSVIKFFTNPFFFFYLHKRYFS